MGLGKVRRRKGIQEGKDGRGQGAECLPRTVPTRPVLSSPRSPLPAGLGGPAAPHLTPAWAALGAGPASRSQLRPGAAPTRRCRLPFAGSPLPPGSPLALELGATSFPEGGTSGCVGGEAPARKEELPSITKERAPPPPASAYERVRGTLAPPLLASTFPAKAEPAGRGARARDSPGAALSRTLA